VGLARVGLARIRRLPTLLPGGGLGVGSLLLPGVGGLARLPVVLGLGPVTSWSLLAIGPHLSRTGETGRERE